MPEFLTEYLDGLTEGLLSTLKTPDAYLNKIALTASVVVIGLLIHMFLQRMITRNVNEYKKKITLQRVVRNTLTIITSLVVLFVWIQAINALILMALLFGVFIAFMVRGLTSNIIGYFVIKYRQYFEIGHRVEINNIIGDVIDINPIHFKLLEVRGNLSSDARTGRIIKLPNSIIFQESIEIVGVDNVFIWHESKFVLSFDSDWKDAERIITNVGNTYFTDEVLPAIEETNEHILGETSHFEPVLSVDTNTEGIILTIRYMVDYRNGTNAKTYLQRNVLAGVEANPQIKFATLDIRVFPE